MLASALTRLAKADPRKVLGLMSGTSADGVDVALVEIREGAEGPTFQLLHFGVVPYPATVRRAVLEVAQAGRVELADVARLNVLLGEVFAEAARRVIEEAGLSLADVDLIGSHGQTIGHFPEPQPFLGREIRSTLQVGDPAVIAKRTGVVTVGDFRIADIAVGGEGAPLVPFFDWLVLRRADRNLVALNIGGIANLTVVPRNAGLADVVAFDTGPGNALIDCLAEMYWGEKMDADAHHARGGRIQEKWLDELLEDSYFQRPPPKSTGREHFGRAFAERLAREGARRRLSPEDVIATATALTARSVARALEDFVLPATKVDEILVSGGGARNAFLLALLEGYLPGIPVRTSAEVGIDPDAKEAIAFAVLANEAVAGRPGNCPAATGAGRPTVLGKICLP